MSGKPVEKGAVILALGAYSSSCSIRFSDLRGLSNSGDQARSTRKMRTSAGPPQTCAASTVLDLDAARCLAMPAPECLTAALPEATPCALSMRMQEDLLVCCSEHEFALSLAAESRVDSSIQHPGLLANSLECGTSCPGALACASGTSTRRRCRATFAQSRLFMSGAILFGIGLQLTLRFSRVRVSVLGCFLGVAVCCHCGESRIQVRYRHAQECITRPR